MPADLKKNGQRRLCFSTPHPPLRFESDFHSLPPIFPPHTTSSYIPSLLFDSRKKAKARAKSRAPHEDKRKRKRRPKKNSDNQDSDNQDNSNYHSASSGSSHGMKEGPHRQGAAAEVAAVRRKRGTRCFFARTLSDVGLEKGLSFRRHRPARRTPVAGGYFGLKGRSRA
jgi:hypothetical protein